MAFLALVGAGFRRFSTYRQATVAGIVANTAFGFLNCYVLLAVTAARGGHVAGYRSDQLSTLAWINQGLLATVGIWGDTTLAQRIASGDVVSDLLRPIHPVVAFVGDDLGRAGFAAFTRALAPLLIGSLVFDLYVPSRPGTAPLFLAAVLAGTVLCGLLRYLVNACAYWVLDSRGPAVGWAVIATLLGGLYFPIRFLPGPAVAVIWLATPFPSLMQAPTDIAVERVSTPVQVGMIGVQLVWIGLAAVACRFTQRAAERRLVVQGG